MSKHLKVLGLTGPASPRQIHDRWIELAKKHHPDKGGDPQKFAELGDSYRAAVKEAESMPCQECKGVGTVFVRSRGSFSGSDELCPHCEGSRLQYN